MTPRERLQDLLAIITSAAHSTEERKKAFYECLSIPSELWGGKTLWAWALAVALTKAKFLRHQTGLPLDLFDTDAAATDALLQLPLRGPQISKNLRAWLRKVIYHKLVDQVRLHSKDSLAVSIDKHLGAAEAALSQKTDDDAQADEKHRRAAALRNKKLTKETIAAVRGLKGRPGAVMRALVLERMERSQVCTKLGMTRGALRTNISRAWAKIRAAHPGLAKAIDPHGRLTPATPAKSPRGSRKAASRVARPSRRKAR